MQNYIRSNLGTISWVTAAVVVGLALVAWAGGLGWQFGELTVYKVFPLLGLLAFSLMWSHYVAGALKRFAGGGEAKVFFKVTVWFVLGLILLHPGLFIVQLALDGYGLPPGSYAGYVAPAMLWAVMLGTISLFVFLSYELHRFFGERSWWKYVLYANDAAMIGIFIHALSLGSNIQMGWYRFVWILYGVSLVAMLLYKYAHQLKLLKSSASTAR